ncbi:MAG TPA: hypothetical protein VGS22_29095, partial [Thermoanaerobaculia bacterium]|nr:hypothetical protein [Thermoanaerobaculia bacterium]
MSRPTSRPLVPALVLCFLVLPFLSPAARAASWWDGGQALSLLGRLWGSLSAVWGEEGCIMDPNGGCRERSSVAPIEGRRQITANEGCIMDPDGKCRDRQ